MEVSPQPQRVVACSFVGADWGNKKVDGHWRQAQTCMLKCVDAVIVATLSWRRQIIRLAHLRELGLWAMS